MAPDSAGLRTDERPGSGVHGPLRAGQRHSVPAPVPERPFRATYVEDFNAVKALGRRTGSTRTEDQTALAPFWEGNASVHWNQAANQIARANRLPMSASNRLLAVLNIAMADTAITTWSAKRFYGAIAAEVTWRPVTAIRWQTPTAIPILRPIRRGCRSSTHPHIRSTPRGIQARTARPRRFCSIILGTDKSSL